MSTTPLKGGDPTPATITFDNPRRRSILFHGADKKRRGTGNLGIYATNGVAVTPLEFQLDSIDDLRLSSVASDGSVLFVYDKAGGKIKAFSAIGSEVPTESISAARPFASRPRAVNAELMELAPISTQQTSPDTTTVRTITTPSGTSTVVISVETTAARVTFDGSTPAAGNGIVIPIGVTPLVLALRRNVGIRFTSTAAAAATVDVAFFA